MSRSCAAVTKATGAIGDSSACGALIVEAVHARHEHVQQDQSGGFAIQRDGYSPWPAVTTSWPCLDSRLLTTRRLTGWSSTTRCSRWGYRIIWVSVLLCAGYGTGVAK
jgi:hypothetical protein